MRAISRRRTKRSCCAPHGCAGDANRGPERWVHATVPSCDARMDDDGGVENEVGGGAGLWVIQPSALFGVCALIYTVRLRGAHVSTLSNGAGERSASAYIHINSARIIKSPRRCCVCVWDVFCAIWWRWVGVRFGMTRIGGGGVRRLTREWNPYKSARRRRTICKVFLPPPVPRPPVREAACELKTRACASISHIFRVCVCVLLLAQQPSYTHTHTFMYMSSH